MNRLLLTSPLLNGDMVYRYSGEVVLKKESLYDHIGKMMAMAFLIDSNVTFEFDIKELIYRISIHDLEESVSQDIIRRIKHYDKVIKDKIDDISYDLLAKELVKKCRITEAKEAKSHQSIEGCLVHFLDVYQAFQYLYGEVVLLHNENLRDTLLNDCIPYLQSVIELICERYPELEELYQFLPNQIDMVCISK